MYKNLTQFIEHSPCYDQKMFGQKFLSPIYYHYQVEILLMIINNKFLRQGLNPRPLVPSQTCYHASYLVTFFDDVPFQSSNFLVKLIIQISPTVVGSNEAIRTQNSKTINNMGANGWVNILRLVFSYAWPVPSPVGVIAYNLYQNKPNNLINVHILEEKFIWQQIAK